MITLTYKYISFITLLIFAFAVSAVTVSADVVPEQSRASITRSTDRDHAASRDHAGRDVEASEEDEDSNSSDGNNGSSGEEGIILTVERNSNGEIVITYSGNTGGSGASITVTVDGEVIAKEGGQQQGGSGDGADGQDGTDGNDGSNDDEETEHEEEEEDMNEDDEGTEYRVERPERDDRGSRR